MAGSIFLGSKYQSFLDNGTVNAGGFVYFYEVGTSTPKDTYSDSAITTPNVNPVVLDSAGRADIWLSGDYDVKVEDSSNNLIDTFSNINPSSASSTNNVNIVLNGSFETDTNNDGTPDNWDLLEYTGSTNTKVTTDYRSGTSCMKFTSVGNGGGRITSTDLFGVNPDVPLYVSWATYSSVVDVRNIAQIMWYQHDSTASSTPYTTLWDEAAANATSWQTLIYKVTPPSDATYAKFRFYGCDSSDATPGSTWLDDVTIYKTIETDYYTDGGSADTYTASPNPKWVSYVAGDTIKVDLSAINTGACTLNVNGLGATSIKTQAGNDPIAGQLTSGIHTFQYNGTYFIVLDPLEVYPAEAIYGLTLSNDATDVAKDLDIATGITADSNGIRMELSSAFVKQTDASWAAGTNQGMLDGTEAVAGTPDASTWLHIYLIRKDSDGSIDVLASQSATAPTMPTGYTAKRRIGAIYMDATPNILAFHQYGDEFWWDSAIADVSGTACPTSMTAIATSVPTGINVKGHYQFNLDTGSTGGKNMYFYHGDTSDTATNLATVNLWNVDTNSGNARNKNESGDLWTDTSGQIYGIGSSTAANYYVGTMGWTDPRGKF